MPRGCQLSRQRVAGQEARKTGGSVPVTRIMLDVGRRLFCKSGMVIHEECNGPLKGKTAGVQAAAFP